MLNSAWEALNMQENYSVPCFQELITNGQRHVGEFEHINYILWGDKNADQHMNRVLCSNTAPCIRTKFWKILQPSTSKNSSINT